MPRRSPINVVYVRDHLIPSGGTTYLRDTLPRFDADFVRTSLCVLQPPAEGRAAQFSGIPTFFAGHGKRAPWHLFRLARLLARQNPDLLVLSGPKSMVLGGLAARMLRVPGSAHLNNMLEVPPLMRLAQRRLLAGSNASAVSRAVRAWASTYYGLAPARIEVIHPAINLTRFPAAAGMGAALRASLGIPPKAPVLALIGRLVVAQKGQDLMIRAMTALLRRHPDAVLLLAGDGPDRQDLESLIRHLGLERAVHLLGRREDVAAILAASDVVVVPSVCEEGFGLVAVEGWAAGVPVVAFESGGIGEIVRHRQTGLLVPKGDVAGLADAISGLLEDRAEAARLARAGQREVARFTVDRHVATLTAFYARIVADSRRS